MAVLSVESMKLIFLIFISGEKIKYPADTSDANDKIKPEGSPFTPDPTPISKIKNTGNDSFSPTTIIQKKLMAVSILIMDKTVFDMSCTLYYPQVKGSRFCFDRIFTALLLKVRQSHNACIFALHAFDHHPPRHERKCL